MKINFLEHESCETAEYNDYFNSTSTYGDFAYGGFVDVNVGMHLYKENITESPAWNWDENQDYLANLKFCTRVDLLFSEAFNGTEAVVVDNPIADVLSRSVGYVKVKYDISVNMLSGFSISIEAEETEASTDSQVTRVTYGVEACHCDNTSEECLADPPVINQNSVLDICIKPEGTEDIVIKSVERFSLTQGLLSTALINGGNRNPIITVSEEGRRTVIVSTIMLSVYFLDPAPVQVSGTAVLDFKNTGRRQLAKFDAGIKSPSEGRFLQEIVEGVGDFSINVQLANIETKETGSASFYLSSLNFIPLVVVTVGVFGLL